MPTRILLVLLVTRVATQAGELTFVETFDDDPVAAGRFVVRGDANRFVMRDGAVLAHYDTGRPTAMLMHRFDRPITAAAELRIEADLVISSAGFFADASAFAQIGLGLINTQTTGDDRPGGAPEIPDAFDVIGLSYFPNVSRLFGGPTLGGTMIESDRGQGFFGAIRFAFGPETDMTPEGPLPLDVPLTMTLSYVRDEETGVQTVTVTVRDANGPLPINADGADFQPGGSDGDATTIQTITAGSPFTVDAVAITLWEDTWGGGASTVTADVVYESLRVWVRWPTGDGDADNDGDVDLADRLALEACFAGPGVYVVDDCLWADLDGDGDVDLADVVAWQAAFTGAQ